MKFAVKRTWPDRPKSWERQGEAESAEAFALDFASDAGLGVGTQLMVVLKDEDDPVIELFQVIGTDPCALGPIEPHAADAAAPTAAEPAPGLGAPNLHPGLMPVGSIAWNLGVRAMIFGGPFALAIFLLWLARTYHMLD